MLETEVLSGIPKAEFDAKIVEFTAKYGQPKVQKRLGIILASYSTEIDTRLKITNGQAHLVQKIGDGKQQVIARQEINLDLSLPATDLLKLVRMIQNLGAAIPGFTSVLQQYDSRIFDLPSCEVKFYHQFGENSYYGFELELTQEGVDIHQELESLGLKLDGVNKDEDYWHDYDQKYNLDAVKLSDTELLHLLDKYLSPTK